jgi:hypothetical protein
MMRSMAKYSMKNSVCCAAPGHRACAAWRGRCGRRRRRCAGHGGPSPYFAWSCRRRGADRSCPLRCARRARPSVPARKRLRARFAEIFDGILVAQPVRPLDGVVHVPAPVVLAHIAKRRGNAALRCNRVRAGGERPWRYKRLSVPACEAPTTARRPAPPAPNHDHIIGVVDRRQRLRNPFDCSLFAALDGVDDREKEPRHQEDKGNGRNALANMVMRTGF